MQVLIWQIMKFKELKRKLSFECVRNDTAEFKPVESYSKLE